MSPVFADWLLQCQDFHVCRSNKRYWAGHYPGTDLAALFSWDSLNDCLSTNRITNDRLRLSTAREYEQFNRRVFRPTRDAFGRATDHLQIHELQAVMQSGVTAVLEAVNELSRPVGALTERLAWELDVRSTANAYLSFGQTSGFGVHHDDHDVIVVQLDGRKMWQFFSAPHSPAKATIQDLKAPSEQDCGEHLVVSAGDIMYIPRGTWHDVTAMNEKSLHLTISLVQPTLLDFVQWELKNKQHQLCTQEIDRTALSSESLLAFCRQAMAGLFTEGNLEAFLKHYHASHAVSHIKATFPSLHAAHIGDRFRRIATDVVVSGVSDDGRTISVFMLGRIHQLTHDEYTLLLALPCGSEKPGAALLTDERQWADIAPLLTRLMDQGLAGKTSHDQAAASAG